MKIAFRRISQSAKETMKKWIALAIYTLVLLFSCHQTQQKHVWKEFVVMDAEGKPVREAEVYIITGRTSLGDLRSYTLTQADNREILSQGPIHVENGSFSVDMHLYYPHWFSMFVVAKGYHITMLPFMTRERCIVLLDRERYRTEKVPEGKSGEVCQKMTSSLLGWAGLHGIPFIPSEFRCRMDLVRDGLHIPALPLSMVVDDTHPDFIENYPLFKKAYEICCDYDEKTQPEEEIFFRMAVQDRINRHVSGNWVPIFYQYNLSSEQRKSLKLPSL